MMRRAMALIPVAIFVALGIALYLAVFRGDPSELPSALIGKPAPQFNLPGIPGTDIPGLANADLGGTPRLLNVWASWCAPCRTEHPQLMALAARPDIEVFGLNYKDRADAAAGFLRQLGNPFARVGYDPDNQVAIDFGIYGVPESFVVDADGTIVYRHVGPLTDAVVADEILPLLKETAPAEADAE